MHHERLITGVAAALAVCAAVLVVLGVAYNPAIVAVAAAFGAAAYFMWFQASGRLAARVYQSVERQARQNAGGNRHTAGRWSGQRGTDRGGFGAGPREEWSPPGGGRRRRQQSGRRAQGEDRRRRQRVTPDDGPTAAEAYRTLGLDPDADESAIKQAYRERVKDVHPDTEGGDEEAFKRVTRAYERLT